MKVNVTETTGYESDIKIVDIDAANEEEAQLSVPGLSTRSRIQHRSLVSKGSYRGFFVVAVMTFTGPDLPVGTELLFPEIYQRWTVIAKNKAARHVRFNPEEHEEDEAQLKAKLREWAEKSGIVFVR